MHDALKAVLVGNAGATGDYETDDASGHWSHELRLADPEVLVVDHKRIRAERLVDHRRDAATRLEGDATWWIDPTNGMPLKLGWHQTAGDQVVNDKAGVAEWNTVFYHAPMTGRE